VGLSIGWAGSVDHCTITQNSQGGAKIYQPDFFDTTVRFSNNIIAGNSGGPDVENVDFVFSLAASNGHNLIGAKQPFIDADGLFVDIFVDGVNGDQVGTLAAPLDPLLGPLQNNGGPTFTHALLSGSPAIDAGDNTGAPTTDQRGFSRIVGGTIDIGAYELNAVPCQIPLTVKVYFGFQQSGGGAPYSSPLVFGTLAPSDVLFGTATGFNWHPFGLLDFGADITGALAVSADGTYTFTLDSDDGSLLFIDGVLVVDNGNTHGPTAISGTATLSAGTHPFEIQFFECCGGPSGVDLILPQGVSYCLGNHPPEVACPTHIPAGCLNTSIAAEVQDLDNDPITVTFAQSGFVFFSTVVSNTVTSGGDVTFFGGIDDLADIDVTADDGRGGVARCTIPVVRSPTCCVFPIVTCSEDLVVTTPPAQLGAVVTFPDPTANFCDGQPLNRIWTCTPPSGSLFPIGTTAITCSTINDKSPGPTLNCSFNVTVQPGGCIDTQPPTSSYAAVKAFQTFANPLRKVGQFQLLASDDCDPDPLIYISDSATGFVAGPFHNGDQVEIAKGPSLSNSQHPPASGPNSAVIFLQGGARMYSVDSGGNTSPITKVL